MSDPAKNLETVSDSPQIIKTASYHIVKNDFDIHFLRNTLSHEITKLVDLQSYTISMLEELIKNLKKRPLNGGSE